MKKALLVLLAVAAALGHAHGAEAAPCSVPSQRPLWVDYGAPQFAETFGRPGIVVAGSGEDYPARMRAAGATTLFWDMYLNKRIGTPSVPANPALLSARADALVAFAVTSLGCETPWIVMNELFGASTPTPWTPTTSQYRANVIDWARLLAARGAKPILLVSSNPYTGIDAAPWWRELASVADIVLEKYFAAPGVHRAGPDLGSRRMRTSMRETASKIFSMNIPAAKVGFMLGFQTGSGIGGREGLQPASAWFEVAKLQALAARQVARELGTAYVFSWGWGVFNAAGADPDKAGAACVWLWARDPALCDAPGSYRFDTDIRAGQIDLPAGVRCTLGDATITLNQIGELTRVTRDAELALSALYGRLVEGRAVTVAPADVLAAERTILARRFSGSRTPYLSAITRSRATLAAARGVIADELRRRALQAQLRLPRPTAAQIQEFGLLYGDLEARELRVTPAPSWLPSGRGAVLSLEAPAAAFTVPTGKEIVVRTFEGLLRIRALDEPTPLGALPDALARPAISRAIAAAARVDAYHAWTWKRQKDALDDLRCTRDRLPAIGAVELTAFLPELAVEESG